MWTHANLYRNLTWSNGVPSLKLMNGSESNSNDFRHRALADPWFSYKKPVFAAVQFVFGPQENGFAGYAELELLATAVTGTGGRDLLPTTSRLTVDAGAILDLNGNQQTIAGLEGAGTVTNAASRRERP